MGRQGGNCPQVPLSQEILGRISLRKLNTHMFYKKNASFLQLQFSCTIFLYKTSYLAIHKILSSSAPMPFEKLLDRTPLYFNTKSLHLFKNKTLQQGNENEYNRSKILFFLSTVQSLLCPFLVQKMMSPDLAIGEMNFSDVCSLQKA